MEISFPYGESERRRIRNSVTRSCITRQFNDDLWTHVKSSIFTYVFFEVSKPELRLNHNFNRNNVFITWKFHYNEFWNVKQIPTNRIVAITVKSLNRFGKTILNFEKYLLVNRTNNVLPNKKNKVLIENLLNIMWVNEFHTECSEQKLFVTF